MVRPDTAKPATARDTRKPASNTDHRFPGKIWVVSHKPIAVAAGLGQMGVHRNVIHPRFGNFILLGTILVAALWTLAKLVGPVYGGIRATLAASRARKAGNEAALIG